jgi:adhesin transport system membrane fusion protein
MKPQLDVDTIRRQLGDPALAVERRWTRPLLWACLATLLCFILWAAWATVDEITRGQGQVVPTSRQQSIQSLEGGIIAHLLVEEGQIVEAGQPVVELDKTRFRSAFLESKSEAQGLQAAIARLEAEVFGVDDIRFPDALEANQIEMDIERSLFQARRQRLEAASQSILDELASARRQLEVVEPLVQSQAVGEMELLKLRREIANMNGRLAELHNGFVQTSYEELVANKARLAALEQVLVQRNDQLQRTRLLSPMRGVVNNITITTRSGVVPPGEEIMQITPLEDQLLIETRVSPKDVAFVAPGMPATVKISAYDYSLYGGLDGTVEQISSDTLKEQTPRGEETYYRVLVRTERNWLKHGDEKLPIKPGMIAVVDIQTGERSVLSYLLKPITRLQLR